MKQLIHKLLPLVAGLFSSGIAHAGEYSQWQPLPSERAIEYCSKTNADGSFNFRFTNVSNRVFTLVVKNRQGGVELFEELPPGKTTWTHTYTSDINAQARLK